MWSWPFVAPPADFVAAAFGGGDDVEAAVAVDVGGDDHVGVGPAVLEELHVPGTAGVAAVLEVGDAAGDVPGGCDDFDVAVVVEVGGDGFEGVGEAFTDYVLAPFACGGLAVVFVPDDLVMLEGDAGGVVGREHAESHDDVEVAIAVHVDGVAVDGLGGVVDDVFDPGLVRGVARVFVPNDLIADAGGAEQIDVAVAVDVGGVDSTGLGDVVFEDVFDPVAVAVFVPDELVAFAPGRCGDVEMAVPVEVGDGDGVGACEGAFVDVAGAPGAGQARVSLIFKVEQTAVDVVDEHEFGAAVAVDVGDLVAFEPLGGALVDDVAGEVAVAVVFEPVEADVGVGGDEVGYAVAGEVEGGDAVGVFEAVLGEVFGEVDEVGHWVLPGGEWLFWGHDSRDGERGQERFLVVSFSFLVNCRVRGGSPFDPRRTSTSTPLSAKGREGTRRTATSTSLSTEGHEGPRRTATSTPLSAKGREGTRRTATSTSLSTEGHEGPRRTATSEPLSTKDHEGPRRTATSTPLSAKGREGTRRTATSTSLSTKGHGELQRATPFSAKGTRRHAKNCNVNFFIHGGPRRTRSLIRGGDWAGWCGSGGI